ncbi:uncharacterized protein BJ212DRAFT_1300425 [Suillus subaureus]|uniref:Elongin-C n=1 Tax=Suillus subaureus TaxID=48587 RepID=A0A9P7JC67_9AGAM|nr:uncharacterized protein BJ212DRAFT_1300425 [Suillus subaureus]KAG1814610.1 hypothetical protein BJ212DRAFT_1300425 [Suillus subaureus]
MSNDVQMDDAGAEKRDDWVKITSSDGYSFLVKRNVAAISGTLKNMLSEDSSFREAIANTCPISERRNSAAVVEKAYYEGPGSKEGVDVNEFTERIPPEVALELCVTSLPVPL